MSEGARPHALRRVTLIALGVIVAVAALLAFFGVGAQLTQPRTVAMVVRIDQIPPEMVSQVHVGDPAFTDVDGVPIGRVTRVLASPQPVVASDARGATHLAGDPTNSQIEVTVTGDGRVGGGLVILNSQAVVAGRPFTLISNRYYLAGIVASVDVR